MIFECTYTGSSPPHWDVFIPDQSNILPTDPTETLVRGRDEPLPGGGYLNYTSSDNQMAMLEVLATRAVNGSEFQCVIIGDPDVSSRRASLTVFGECTDCTHVFTLTVQVGMDLLYMCIRTYVRR